MVNLLRTLHARPELAHNIIKFNASLYPVTLDTSPPSLFGNWHRQWSVNHERSLPNTTLESIRHMVNIKSLTLRDFDWLETLCRGLVQNLLSVTTSLAYLTALVIKGHQFSDLSNRRDCSPQISRILLSQPLSGRLRLRSGGWDLERHIRQSDIPRLSYLKAERGEDGVIIYGGPITSLDIRFIRTVPSLDVWKALAVSTAPITSMTLNVSDHIIPVVGMVAIYVKDVQELVINGVLFNQIPLIIDAFPSFPCLRNLHFVVWDLWDGPKNGGMCKKMNEDQRMDAIESIRLRCPQFQNLEIRQKC
ncbi:hypothetical protein FRB95_001219 [Tulasnella sp. JGI-2019a]|nr:hypothetical protein FRB95_001219 [Tulasnella sp. JGI-2019a]